MYLICKLQEIELSHLVLLFLNILVIVSNLTVNMGIVGVSQILTSFPVGVYTKQQDFWSICCSDVNSLEKHHIVFHNS